MTTRRTKILTATGQVLYDLKKQYGVTNVLIGDQDGPDRVRLARLSYQPKEIPHTPEARDRLAKRIAGSFVKAVKVVQKQLPEDSLARLQEEVYERISTAFETDSSGTLPLAASGYHNISMQAKSETGFFQVQGAEFNIGDVTYKFLADDYGNVFLDSAPGSDNTHLILGNTAYRIKQTKGNEHIYRIVQLGAVKLMRFFAEKPNDPKTHRIGFITVTS